MKNLIPALRRMNGYHVSLALLALAAVLGGGIAGFEDTQSGLNVCLLLAASILSVLAIERLVSRDAQRGFIRRTMRAVVVASGFFLTGLLLGVMLVLGFIALVLIPFALALVGAGWAVWRLRKSPAAGGSYPAGRPGFSLDVVLVSVSLALLMVAVSVPLALLTTDESRVISEAALLVAALATVIGGSISSAIASHRIVLAVAAQRTLVPRVAALGEGLAVLMLHIIFAVGPTIVAIWATIAGAL